MFWYKAKTTTFVCLSETAFAPFQSQDKDITWLSHAPLPPVLALLIIIASAVSVFCRAPLHKSQPVAALTICPLFCLSSTTLRDSFTSLSWTSFHCLSSQSHSGTLHSHSCTVHVI